jgi:spore coat protein SA
MIYDLLPELEEFCPNRGGAISKVVANTMRFDACRVVVCSAANNSWGFDRGRIITVPELLIYDKIRGRRFLPAWLKERFYRRAYRPLLSKLQPGDIVWCHNQAYLAAALKKHIRRLSARLVYQVHDRHIVSTAEPILRSLSPDAWVFVSEALRQRYLTVFPHLKDTHVIHNGTEEKLFYPRVGDNSSKNGPPIIMYVGRLDEEKGTHILVESMRILQERNIRVQCKVIGSSFSGGSKPTPYVRSLHRNSPDNVEYLGYRPPEEVARELRAADILACPSVCEEGFGNVNVEAMACGLPVVATRIGGIPEIAAEGGVLLVEPNSPMEMANALQELVMDADLRAKTACQGLASFRRRFTGIAIARQHRNLIESLEESACDRTYA